MDPDQTAPIEEQSDLDIHSTLSTMLLKHFSVWHFKGGML